MKRQKNCIFLLTRGYSYGSLRNYKFLIKRNWAISKFLRSSSARTKGWSDFELVVFHEGNINILTQIVLSIVSFQKLKFISIEKDFKLLNSNLWSGASEMPLEYSLMCQFQYFHVWKYLQKYEIACRIDEDIIMRCFPSISKEFTFITGSIFPETHRLTNDTLPLFLSKIGDEQFYDHQFPLTNFFVTKSSLWNQPQISAYLSNIAHQENSANYRWCDIPIIGVTLHKYLKWSTLQGIDTAIEYYHGSHNALVKGGVQLDSF